MQLSCYDGANSPFFEFFLQKFIKNFLFFDFFFNKNNKKIAYFNLNLR